MGAPMAGHLALRAGMDVTVFNRTQAKAEAWYAEYGGHIAQTPEEAAQTADLVCLCVGNDQDLESVMGGVFQGAKSGTIIVDHTTVSADISRKLYAQAQEKGLHFLDAPVSGGQAGAINAQLTVMAGGDRAPFEHVEPVLRKAYAREIRLMGASGAGQITKMVNQICIAGLLQGLAEGLAFGQHAGLDMDEVFGVIGKGAAQSWQMDNRGKTMVRDQFDFGFAVDWMIKDLQIALDEADVNGAALPVTRQILTYYQELQANGNGRYDTSALIKRLI